MDQLSKEPSTSTWLPPWLPAGEGSGGEAAQRPVTSWAETGGLLWLACMLADVAWLAPSRGCQEVACGSKRQRAGSPGAAGTRQALPDTPKAPAVWCRGGRWLAAAAAVLPCVGWGTGPVRHTRMLCSVLRMRLATAPCQLAKLVGHTVCRVSLQQHDDGQCICIWVLLCSAVPCWLHS
jgi:hypothetical protein